MKAIILARVSTEEQKEVGNSLPAQIERLKIYCKRNDFEIVKTFSFDESAYKTKRDNFDKILDYIKSNKNKVAVCFDKVDRFSRNIFDKRVALLYELAMKDKIELHFSSDNLVITPDISATEKFHFGINLGLAKYYSDAISDSVKRSNEKRTKDGKWPVKAPIGYKNDEDEKENKIIITDHSRNLHIKKIFEMYASGNHSLRTIKKETDKVGLRSNTKANKLLTISLIARILDNPFYYGMMKIKGELYPHKYQPLISKELFDKVQQVKAGYPKKPCKYASKPFIFRGLIKCADCGCTITAETHKGHVYYRCTNFRKMHKKMHYVKEEELLDPVREIFKNIQLSDEKIKEITEELRRVNESKNQFNEQIVKGLREDYDKIENRISNMLDARFDGSITTDMYDKKLKEYKEKQQEIMDEMQKHNKADKSYYITVNKVLSLAQRACEIFENSEIDEKRQLLNFILQNLELKERKLVFKTKTPFDTVLFANKCSNMGEYWELNPG